MEGLPAGGILPVHMDPQAPAPDTADELFRQMYQDLRRLASSRLRRSENITMLDTTALVHESYLRFQHQSDLGGMTQGQFLVMDSIRAGMIFDRQNATIEVSREHSDYFTRNLAAILVEERLALCVFNSTAVVYGGWPFGS